MIELEIIFGLSAFALLVMWSWFIVLAFQTSRLWGIGLIFFFPFSPLMFAYRFERKTRKLIYPLLGSLLFFTGVNFYIFFATNDFFEILSHQIEEATPHISYTRKPQIKKLNLPKPTPIPPPLPVVATPKEEEQPVHIVRIVHRYKTIDLGSAYSYIGKQAIITTATVVHRGQLTSVNDAQIEITKKIAGGETRMGIQKSKIEKLEVYL